MCYLKQLLPFIVVISCAGCTSDSSSDKKGNQGVSEARKPGVDTVHQLSTLGTWVSFSTKHFQIVEIKDSSTATVYTYMQVRKPGDDGKITNRLYSKNEGKIDKWDAYSLSIATKTLHLFYELRGDTLYRIAEPGRVDTLIRVYTNSPVNSQ